MLHCFVENCESSESNGDRLFNVPKGLKDKYLFICTSREYSEKTRLYICSKHFTKNDIHESTGKLKKGILPSQNVNVEKLNKLLEAQKPPAKRSRKQSFTKTSNVEEIEFEDGASNDSGEMEWQSKSKPDDHFDSDDSFESDDDGESDEESDYDIEVVGSDESDSSGNQPTFESINITIQMFEKDPEFYLGIQKNNIFLVDVLTSELNISKRDLYIVFFKLRRAEPDKSIADRFDISHQRVSQIISENIELISVNMAQFIRRPANDDIKKNLPESFWHRYHNVTDLVDCFEVPLEKPTNPMEQALTWSSYYSDNTAKYHIGTTPDGLITFISKGYGGRISDEKIVKESNYIEFLPPGAVVMADRGYKDLDGYFRENGIPFIRPPSVMTGTKLPKDVALKAKEVAALRINVERTIRKIRGFSLISKYSQIHAKYRKYLDFFVIIACGLANMQKPIYKIYE